MTRQWFLCACAWAHLNLDVPLSLTDQTAAAVRGDLDLDPVMWERAGVVASRPAAVLVGVVDRPEPTVLLTQRTAELNNHAGQIAFPAGRSIRTTTRRSTPRCANPRGSGT